MDEREIQHILEFCLRHTGELGPKGKEIVAEIRSRVAGYGRLERAARVVLDYAEMQDREPRWAEELRAALAGSGGREEDNDG